jgi:hypothetical protein
MKIHTLAQLLLAVLLFSNADAWRGDRDAFDGPVGEYVRTLRKSYSEDRTLDVDATTSRMQGVRKMKSSKKSKGSKTPAPTVTPPPTCPPSNFVSGPSKKSKITNKSRKSGKSAVTCVTVGPTILPTCPPTVAPTPVSKSKKSKKSAKLNFSCGAVSGSSAKKSKRLR